MLLNEAIDSWLDSARRDASLAATTRKTYRSWCARLTRRVGDGADACSLTPDVLRSTLSGLAAAGMRPRTLRAALMAWRALGRWLVSEGYVACNPADGVRPPHLDAARRELPTDEDVADLLAACDRLVDERRSALAMAIVQVLITTALRRAELLGLRLRDVGLRDRSLLVDQGKGGKSRRVYMPADAFGAVRTWLAVRGRCQHDWLWDYDHRRRLGDEGLRTLLRELCAIAGHRGDRGLLPHGLRHNCATRLARRGADLESLRELLGHSSLQTTSIYLHTDQARLREIADLAGLESPRPQETPLAAEDHAAREPATWRRAAWRRQRAG